MLPHFGISYLYLWPVLYVCLLNKLFKPFEFLSLIFKISQQAMRKGITHWPPVDVKNIYENCFSSDYFYKYIWWISIEIGTESKSLFSSHHWCRLSLGTVGHQAITWDYSWLLPLSPYASLGPIKLEWDFSFFLHHPADIIHPYVEGWWRWRDDVGSFWWLWLWWWCRDGDDHVDSSLYHTTIFLIAHHHFIYHITPHITPLFSLITPPYS